MLTTVSAIEIVVIVCALTMFLRAVPFLFFGGKKELPKLVRYLGEVLPYAIMSALVVFCIKDVEFTSEPYGAPYLIAIAVTALLHIFFRKTLLSILGGTVAFMVLSRVVFA